MLNAWLGKNFKRIIEIRRWLHQHPEVGFNEHQTSNYCKKLMRDMGYRVVQNKKMQTGFYCDYGNSNGPTLAVRCDLDALPIQEINSLSFSSVNEGVSHACGHDSHMANILGLALYISEIKFHWTTTDHAHDYTYILCIRVKIFSATSRNKIIKWVV